MSRIPTPQWSALPPERPMSPPPRRVLPVLAPLMIVALLWWLGARELAVVVAFAAVIVTVVTTMAPRAREQFDRAAGWVAHLVGSILTVVLLGLVQLLVFAPIALAAKLTRTDPIDPFADRTVESRWLPRSSSDRTLDRRQFADEAYRRRATGATAPVGSPRWIRAAVGAVVLVLLADVALGSLLVRLDRDDPVALDGPIFGFDPLAQEALATQERSSELMADLSRVGIGRPDPFIGWRFGPGVTLESELVNVIDGRRASAATSVAGDAVDVWFFGGSTMYGSGQSDAGTIPSALVRLADDDDIALDATNYGHPADAQGQQVQLLEAELTSGAEIPDLVVFYDGFNDLTLQTQFGVHDEPTHLFFDTPSTTPAEPSVASTVRSWWADHSAAALAAGRVGDLFDDEPTIQIADVDAAPIDTIDPAAAGDAAGAIHRRGVDHVIALSKAYDFDVRFFWQPFLYTKDPLTQAERELVGLPGYDTDVWFPMTDRVRSTLRDPVIDLSDVLDGVDASVFWDFVHTNEAGARLVAEAIYPHLMSVLVS